MTTELAKARARRASVVLGAAAVFTGITAVTLGIDARSRGPQSDAAGPVLTEFRRFADEASKITVVTKDQRYEITRAQNGDWVLRNRGGYPVRRERLAQFTDGLKSLVYVRPMTRDPAKHERLGVGDPTTGGSGVLVEVESATGAQLAELIIGSRPQGALFARRPEDPQAWEVRGELPPLREAALWLDLLPFTLEEARIASAAITPEAGPAYSISQTGQGAFALSPPNQAPNVPASLLARTVGGLVSLQPLDVQPVSAVTGAPTARAVLQTSDGLMLDQDYYRRDDGVWVKVLARSEDPARAEEVDLINAKAAAWAYKISAADFAVLAPTLAELAPSPPPLPLP